MSPTPADIVQQQLDAYNARDIEAWVRTYHPDARQYALHGALLAQGRDAIRERMRERFLEPDLHATLLSRTAMGAIVVDHERVTRTFPEGRGTIEMLCVYEVQDDLIVGASFALGERQLTAR